MLRMKLITCFLILGFISTARQNDANCRIRFYAVQHNQCPCWTFNGTSWDYHSDAHRHSHEITTPSRSNFIAKSIRTFSENSESCNLRWRVCLKIRKGKRVSCSKTLKILPSSPHKYDDITKWKMGRYKMRHLGVHMKKKRFKKVQEYSINELGCIGQDCEESSSEYDYSYDVDNLAIIEETPNADAVINANSSKPAPSVRMRSLFIFHAMIGKVVVTSIVLFLGIVSIYSCIWMCRRKDTFKISHPRIS